MVLSTELPKSIVQNRYHITLINLIDIILAVTQYTIMYTAHIVSRSRTRQYLLQYKSNITKTYIHMSMLYVYMGMYKDTNVV